MNKRIVEFYENLYSLSYITRYSGMAKIKDESVAEHSFYVASLVIELDKYYKFDVGKATIIAVTHDWAEAVTGDITIAVKREHPEIARAVKRATEVESMAYPKWLYRYHLELSASETVESLIVHMADIIQCAQYSAHEIKLGNTGFMSDVYAESIARLAQIEERLVDYEQ